MTKLKKGFTLIELIVVVAIIALLAGIVVGGITLARQSAVEAERKGNLKSLQTALEAYAQKHGNKYPAGNNIINVQNALIADGVLGSKLNLVEGATAGVAADYYYATNSATSGGAGTETSGYILTTCKYGNDSAPVLGTFTAASGWPDPQGCNNAKVSGSSASNVLLTIKN